MLRGFCLFLRFTFIVCFLVYSALVGVLDYEILTFLKSLQTSLCEGRLSRYAPKFLSAKAFRA